MPIEIRVPSEGVVVEFPDGTDRETIEAALRERFPPPPPTGEDYYNLSMSDPAEAHRTMGLPAYAQMRAYEATMPSPYTLEGAKATVGTVWEGAKEYATQPWSVLGPAVTGDAAMRAFAAGTGDLLSMVQDVIHPDTEDTYKQWLTENEQQDSDKNRVAYATRLNEDFKVWQQMMEHQTRGKKIVEESPLPAATESGRLVADPTLMLGGAGAAARLPRVVAGAAARGAGLAATKAGQAATWAGRLPERAAGAISEGAEAAVRKGTNISGGIGAGVMAAGQPLGAVAAIPGALKAGGAALETAGDISTAAGKALGEGGRLGMMERAAQLATTPAGKKIAQGIAVVDPLIALGGKTATGMGVGYGIGGTLGTLAGRKENQWPWEAWNSPKAIHGKGMGLALGGMGGLVFGGVDVAAKSGMRQKRVADVERHMDQLPEKYQALWRDYVEEQGIDNAATLLDIENIMRGELGEAKVIYTREGDGARGVTYGLDDTGGMPTVKINLDKMDAAYTMGHEFGHVLRKVIQLEPQYDAVLQELTGIHVGDEVKAPGAISGAEIATRFNKYMNDLAVTNPAEARIMADKYGQTAELRARFVGEEIVSEHLAALIRGSGTDSMLRGFDTFTQRKLDNLLIRNSSNILGAMASRFTDIGLNPMDSISFKGLEKASPLVNAMLRDLVRARKNLGEEMNLSETSRSVVIDKKDLRAFGPDLAKMGLAEKDASGKYVLKPRKDMQEVEEASHKAVTEILESDDGTGVGLREAVDDAGKVSQMLAGSRFSPGQVAAIGDSALILPRVKENLLALVNVMRNGNIVNMDYWAATTRRKNARTGKYRSGYSSKIKKSNRDAIVYGLELTKAGNITAKVLDWSKTNAAARQLASKGKLGPWGNRPGDFIADLMTYLHNLADVDPVRTRQLFGDEKAQILHDFVQAKERGGAKLIRDLRIERMDNLQPSSERVTMSEETWRLSKARFQPDSFTPEKLPGGEAFVHESGYNILQKGRGKFRVYKPDGELLGLRDTMKSAASLAGRNFRKGEARFMADRAEIDPLGMFSKAESAALELKQAKGSGQQMLAMLKKSGVKAEEMQYLGLDKFLKDKKSVTRDEIHDHIVQNQITVEETVLGSREGVEADLSLSESMDSPRKFGGETKHPDQVEPGAVEGSYRELLLRLPGEKAQSVWLLDPAGNRIREVASGDEARAFVRENPDYSFEYSENQRPYTGGHYGEYPNTLAHIRFQDRQSEKYGKVLDIQEVQSDWHQEGRKKGYREPAKISPLEQQVKELKSEEARLTREVEETGSQEAGDRLGEVYRNRLAAERVLNQASQTTVPDAPFKTSWHELAMKRMIKYAADSGYDAIAWTKGETQAARYDLSKQVDHVRWERTKDGTYNLEALQSDGDRTVSKRGLQESELEGVVGKDIAQRIVDSVGADKMKGTSKEHMFGEGNTGLLTGLDLKVGGEGMKGFYDKMLPRMKTWKKLGLKVEEGRLGKDEPGAVDVTEYPSMTIRAKDPDLKSVPAHIVRLSPEVKAKVREEGMARFQPAGDSVQKKPNAEFVLDEGVLARFQPAPGVNLKNFRDRKVFALASDRLGIGQQETGPTGYKRPVEVEAQGGRGFMHIFNGGGWAFANEGTAKSFLNRARTVAKGEDSVIAGITILPTLNHLNSPYGQLAFANALRAAVDSNVISKSKADLHVKEMVNRILAGKDKRISPQSRQVLKGIKGLASFERAVKAKKINFAAAGMLKEKAAGKTLPIREAEQIEMGMDVRSIAKDIADPQLADADFGSVVALLEIPLNQAPTKTDFHYSYPWTVDGKKIGYLKDFKHISELTSDKRIYTGRGDLAPQPLQTVMPEFDKLSTARFQPAESLTNGTAWRNGAGYNVLQKGKRGKFRAYAPSGKLIGIYDQLKTAQKAAIRLQEKETNLINQ